MEDVRQLLAAGADKVAICTATFHTDIIEKASGRFGSQAIVASIDVSQEHVRSNCGQERWALRPVNYARLLSEAGAGEILLQSIDRDGLMTGYDLDLIRSVSAAVDVPVIACGGCSGPEDMLNAIKAGASACAAGALFTFTDHTPKSCSEYLAAHGIETRIPA